MTLPDRKTLIDHIVTTLPDVRKVSDAHEQTRQRLGGQNPSGHDRLLFPKLKTRYQDHLKPTESLLKSLLHPRSGCHSWTLSPRNSKNMTRWAAPGKGKKPHDTPVFFPNSDGGWGFFLGFQFGLAMAHSFEKTPDEHLVFHCRLPVNPMPRYNSKMFTGMIPHGTQRPLTIVPVPGHSLRTALCDHLSRGFVNLQGFGDIGLPTPTGFRKVKDAFEAGENTANVILLVCESKLEHVSKTEAFLEGVAT